MTASASPESTSRSAGSSATCAPKRRATPRARRNGTASLDPGQRRRLWETVGIVRERGGAVVFATQNLEELDLYATRVAVLQRGVVTFTGPVDEYERVHAAEVFS